jgi:hypothetical protein
VHYTQPHIPSASGRGPGWGTHNRDASLGLCRISRWLSRKRPPLHTGFSCCLQSVGCASGVAGKGQPSGREPVVESQARNVLAVNRIMCHQC